MIKFSLQNMKIRKKKKLFRNSLSIKFYITDNTFKTIFKIFCHINILFHNFSTGIFLREKQKLKPLLNPITKSKVRYSLNAKNINNRATLFSNP